WRTIEGERVPAAPRTVLGDQVEALRALGYEAKVGIEEEVFLFAESSQSAADKGWRGLEPVFTGKRANDMLRSAEQHEVLGDVIDAIVSYGVPIEEVKV